MKNRGDVAVSSLPMQVPVAHHEESNFHDRHRMPLCHNDERVLRTDACASAYVTRCI